MAVVSGPQAPTTSSTKSAISKRGVHYSLNAVLSARHANTRRNVKAQIRKGPWIGDMIVVREYDQIDSLRQILEEPASIYGLKQKKSNSVNVASVVELGIASGASPIADAGGSAKRKRDEEDCETIVEMQEKQEEKIKVSGDAEAMLEEGPSPKKRRRSLRIDEIIDLDAGSPAASDITPHGAKSEEPDGLPNGWGWRILLH